jgi:AcrR family transcriptional regulator
VTIVSASRPRRETHHLGAGRPRVGLNGASGVGMGEVQRLRMLNAAVEVVSELGYGGMSAARVASRAGVSRRTFYEVFSDREDCFLAVFDDAVARAAAAVRDATVEVVGWRDQVRAGLSRLLQFIGDELGPRAQRGTR